LVGDRLRAVPAWAWLGGIVLASFALRAWLAREMVSPFILTDELTYSQLARSFADSGRFLVNGQATSGYGVVYPILISPAYAAYDALTDAYGAVKTINALAMSLAAVPAYFLARRVVSQWLALLAAVLAVALPSMAYTGSVMTENAFYPLFLGFALLLASALERPTPMRQLGLLVLAGLAYETRAQALALLPALLTAPVLAALFGRRPAREALRPWVPLGGMAACVVALVVVGQVARGASISGLLGAYSVVGSSSYDIGEVLRYLLYHWAELDLYVAVAPFAATALLLLRVRRLDGSLQALLAVTVSLSFWIVLSAAVFASKFALRIEERNTFFVAPLFLILLLAWVERAAPRPRVAALLAAGGAALLTLGIPFERFVNESAKSDTLMLLPWWAVQDRVGLEWIAEIVLALALLMGAAFVLVPARFALALPLAVLLFYVVVTKPIWFGPHGFRQSSIGALYQGIRNPDRDWIDAAVPKGARAAMVWSGRTDRFTVNLNQFFNRRIGTIYTLGASTPGGFAERHVRVGRGGVVRLDDGSTVNDPYVVLDTAVDTDGRPIARDPGWGLTLYQVQPPLVSTTSVHGLYPDGWSGPLVTWTRVRCRGGTLAASMSGDATLLGRQPTTVTAHSGVAVRRLTFPQTGAYTIRVPLTVEDGRCFVRFRVRPTKVPGGADTRRLGTHFVAFTYLRP